MTILVKASSFSFVGKPQYWTRSFISSNNALGSDILNDDVNTGQDTPLHVFLAHLDKSCSQQTIVQLRLSDNRLMSNEESEVLHQLKSVTGRLVRLSAGTRVQFTYRYKTCDKTSNCELHKCKNTVENLLARGFRFANLKTLDADHELSLKRGKGKFRTISVDTTTEKRTINLHHDRQKNVLVDTNAAFLRALKVTNEAGGGRPRAGMRDKLRQIQKFVEIIDSLYRGSSLYGKHEEEIRGGGGGELSDSKCLRIVDMGSGMGYLTFATHAHFRNTYYNNDNSTFPSNASPQRGMDSNIEGGGGIPNHSKALGHTTTDQVQVASAKKRRAVRTYGVELRPNLVNQTNTLVKQLAPDFEGLSFIQGRIGDSLSESTKSGIDIRVDDRGGIKTGINPTGTRKCNERDMCDILIALHACDTASDDAIYDGIRRGAEIIVVAPCCHKEIRRQLERNTASTPTGSAISSTCTEVHPFGSMQALLQHGIYRERLAEMVTDTMRALLLEIAGYDTKVFEFIGGEHTAKNVMITAVKRPTGMTETRSVSAAATDDDDDDYDDHHHQSEMGTSVNAKSPVATGKASTCTGTGIHSATSGSSSTGSSTRRSSAGSSNSGTGSIAARRELLALCGLFGIREQHLARLMDENITNTRYAPDAEATYESRRPRNLRPL